MPNLREAPMTPLAILLSDMHITDQVPRGRAEKNWLNEVLLPRAKALRLAVDQYRCPILVAGDVFDRWAPSVEVVNWVMDNLPVMYSIPGQHDMPGHNYEGRYRGAYGTLVRARLLRDLVPGTYGGIIDGWSITAVPWGHPIPPGLGKNSLIMAHVYAADGKATMYHGCEAPAIQTTVTGYSVALYGDNHIPWSRTINGTLHFNHGCWARRTTMEKNYQPEGFGVLWSDGTITRVAYNEPELWVEDAVLPEDANPHPMAEAARYLKFVSACRSAKLNDVDFLGKLSAAAVRAGAEVAGVLTEVREHCAGQRERI